MIKAEEARRQSKANELVIKQKYIQLANELIDKIIEPAIMEAVEHGLFRTEVTLGCDIETFRVVIRKLEEYEYHIVRSTPIAKFLVIDWEERTEPLTWEERTKPLTRDGIGETIKPVYHPNPPFEIT